jgi:uncharacterized spore protein YtfJ
MNLEDVMSGARDTITVQRVFGEPIHENGVTLIPAAVVRGGGGGGEGEGNSSQPAGSGGGFGVFARPVGAYRIKGDDVEWVPAADTTRVLLAAEFIVVVALLVMRSIMRSRSTA